MSANNSLGNLLSNPVAALFAVALVTALASPAAHQLKLENIDPRLSLVNGVMYADRKTLNGHVTERFRNGAPKRDAEYRNGRLHGTTRGWHENGQLDYERTYLNGLETGTHRGWYNNGNRRFEYHYKGGVSHGLAEQWYVSGQPFTRFRYENGQEIGQQQMWNADGTLRANYIIKDGRRFGLPGSVGCRAES